MTKVKICGLMRPEDVQAVNEAQPDFAGFILTAGFRRSIDVREAVRLIDLLDPRIGHVGVFVDEPVRTVAAFAHEYDFDGGDTFRPVNIQLHGSEDDDYIRQLRRTMAYPGWPGSSIIKAFEVRTREDVSRACESAADVILLDAGKGSGETFDWSILDTATRPYILAGGLGPENVADAIASLHPLAVDMSSGVETDGKKDPEKIARAVAAARRGAKVP